MNQVNVLFYARKEEPPEWRDGIITALRDKHNLRIHDLQGPLEQFRGAEVVIDCGGWAGREMVDAADAVKLWQILGTGLDHTDVDYMISKGIMVANCPGTASAIGLAECAMMFILMLTRNWHASCANLERGILWKPFGRSLGGLTLAIIGFGSSGRELARRARPFGLRIEAIDVARPDEAVLAELQPEFLGTPDDLDAVLARADFVSLHLHLNDQTRHLINARRLALMKPTACLINVARGALVEEAALYRALLGGKLGGAGLDVFGHEPPDMAEPAFALPNVILTPHIAGVTDDTVRGRAAVVLENVERIRRGEKPLHMVER